MTLPRDAHGDQHAGRGDLTGELRQGIKPQRSSIKTDSHDQPAGNDHCRHAGQ